MVDSKAEKEAKADEKEAAEEALRAPASILASESNPYIRNEGLNAAVQRVEAAELELKNAKAELKALRAKE